MKKINILEVNNIDLPGKNFNGYNMISELSDETLNIKQAVITKLSKNKNVIEILNNKNLYRLYYKIQEFQKLTSIHNIISITTPALKELDEYKEADIVHFHMFHNTQLSIPSLLEIAKEKKVVLSLHDPWFLTGRCVHFYDCNKWKSGCINCDNLNNMFPLKNDNCNNLWKLKKEVLQNSNFDLIVPSEWMYDIAKKSPMLKKSQKIHLLKFGIDLEKYKESDKKKFRKEFGIKNDDIVLFLRAQKEFKGTEYVLKALNRLNVLNKITILTCDQKGLLDDIKHKYNVIDLGPVNEATIIKAMNSCDIFLFPSPAESFGLMAIEAMACSKPVIVFDNTAIPSVVNAPDIGYLVENRNADELEKAIKYLIQNEKERIKRGIDGRNYCEREYSKDNYNNQLKKIYVNIFKRKQIQKCKNYIEINNQDYLLYEKNVKSYIYKNRLIKNFDYSDVKYVNIINKINDNLYKNTMLKNIKIEMSIKYKLKQTLKSNKIIFNVYNKLRKALKR